MTAARIYTGAEAQELLDRSGVTAAEAALMTVAPRIIVEIGVVRYVVAHLTNEVAPAVADLIAAAPDLAASVAHHEARAERAEGRAAQHAQAAESTSEALRLARLRAMTADDARAELIADVARLTTERDDARADRDAALAHAEELTRALRATQAELALAQKALDAVGDAVDLMAGQRNVLRAAVRVLAAADAEYRRTERPCDADVRRIEDAQRALFALVPEVPA